MIHKLCLESLKPASAGQGRTSRPGGPAQIWLTHDLSDFNDLWPRSQQLKDARCHAFQCADILEVRCNTIASARNMETLFVAVVDAESNPLMLLPLGIERRHGVRILTFLDDARCPVAERSEEHTSELQSPCNLVCRLLLEKKKS